MIYKYLCQVFKLIERWVLLGYFDVTFLPWAQLRAQSELPISSDFINLEILVFVVLPYWILMAALHRIADGLIALNALFVHPH